jgi:hypothetical protein
MSSSAGSLLLQKKGTRSCLSSLVASSCFEVAALLHGDPKLIEKISETKRK